MVFAVQTEVFEGPFDLLLHLILREEVDLYEVNLCDIVDTYVGELERMERLDLEMATEFLLIAAILVELKTKRLLPDPDDLDLEDEFGLWEQRDLLLSRLVECKTFKDASEVLSARMAEAVKSCPRLAGPEDHFLNLVPDLLEGMTAERLRRAFFTATKPRPPEPQLQLDHLGPIRVSVVDAIASLTTALAPAGKMSFRDLTAHLHERIDIVVHFLGILELYKQGLAEISQVGAFGDIVVEWTPDPDLVPGDLDLVDVYEG